jgi:uncharacterized cupredoxin-like copper-binding protein
LTRFRIATLALVAVSTPVWTLAASAARSPKTVTVRVEAGTPTEYAFVLSAKVVKHGRVTFVIVNRGARPHDFKIAGKRSALLAPGHSTRLTVTLKPGTYTYYCTVAGHAVAGMKGSLRVT